MFSTFALTCPAGAEAGIRGWGVLLYEADVLQISARRGKQACIRPLAASGLLRELELKIDSFPLHDTGSGSHLPIQSYIRRSEARPGAGLIGLPRFHGAVVRQV
jgi:hypothetical protein